MLTLLTCCLFNILKADPEETASHVSTMGMIQEGRFPKLVHRYQLSDSVRKKRAVHDHPLRAQKKPSVLVPLLDEVYLAVLHEQKVSLDLNHDGTIQKEEEVTLVSSENEFRGTLHYVTHYQKKELDIRIVFISTDPANNIGFLLDMVRKGFLWDGTPFFLHSYGGRFDHPRAELIVDADLDGQGDAHNKLLRVRVENGELSWKNEQWAFQTSSKGDAVAWKKKGASLLQMGEKIPEFSLVDVKGKRQTSAEYTNKKLLLDFWATWCASCIREHKEIEKLKKKYNINVLGLAQNTEQEVLQYMKRNKMPWNQIALAENHPMLELFQITSLPTYVLLDEEGKLMCMGDLEHIEEILAQ